MKIKSLFDEIFQPQFDGRCKSELILFWIRDTVAIFKKNTNVSTDSQQLKVIGKPRIYLVVGDDHVSAGVGTILLQIIVIFYIFTIHIAILRVR